MIAAELRTMVAELKPGERLPSENELIAHFCAARLTVRRALRQLEDERLVQGVQGRGRFALGPAGDRGQRLDAAHDRIINDVRAAVARARPGQLITTTAAICKLHAVSPPTARKALRALVDEGLLTHVNRRGWFADGWSTPDG